jgi:GH43 family beta-xylosidase
MEKIIFLSLSHIAEKTFNAVVVWNRCKMWYAVAIFFCLQLANRAPIRKNSLRSSKRKMVEMKQAAYSNPFWQGNFPDPFLLKVRGRYYAYATEFETFPQKGALVFPILTSSDMVHWQSVGKAMPALGQSYGRYWAPEVTVYNGTFLLYYAVHTTEFEGGIRVAVADRPEGPFIDSGHDLTRHLFPWAIDPHVFRDEDGQWYLYMTVEYWNDLNGLSGSGNVVDRLVDPFTLSGQPARVTPPSQSWQLFEAKRAERNCVDWYTVEGPAVIKHRDRYYEFFSGGCYYRDNYAISYATSETPMGAGGMRDTSWRDSEGKEGSILLVQGDGKKIISPGHNSLVLGPNNADLYIAYHAWQHDRTARRPFLDRLFWHGEQPWTPEPTSDPQPLPAQPSFRDLFTQAALRPQWKPCAGDWNLSQEAVVQQDEAAPQASLKYQGELSAAWLLEVNVRHIGGYGTYGILLEKDGTAMLRIAFTSSARLAIWMEGTREEPLQSVSLPANLVAGAWHQLLISSNGSLLCVQLDGLQVLEGVVKQHGDSFALFTEQCSAAFSAISLTDHFRDEFLNEALGLELLGWMPVTGNQGENAQSTTPAAHWRVQDGALVQMDTARGMHILLKGSQLDQYELGATMRLREASETGTPAFGLVLWHSEQEHIFAWLAQGHDGWMLSVESEGAEGGASISGQFDLPCTFDPFSWHTLRLRQADGQLTLYLDGPEVLSFPLPTYPAMPGLATRDARAPFTGVWQTGLAGEEARI